MMKRYGNTSRCRNDRRACGGGSGGPVRPTFRGTHHQEPSDQRRRRDIPLSDLFEVVFRIQQAAPERGDQLSVHRIRRRHPQLLERTVFFGASDRR